METVDRMPESLPSPKGAARASARRDGPAGATGAKGVEVFDRQAARYDAWFDSTHGRPLFASEVLCVEEVSRGLPRPWLEVGVGTGRFAEALGIGTGVDPAVAALRYAARRGVRTVPGRGDALPFAEGQFGGVFVIVTLCFAEEPVRLLREAARVTGKGGGVVLGIVPAEGPWGQFYAAKGRAGHPFYSEARFFALAELERLAEAAGLSVQRAASTLFQAPGQRRYELESPRPGAQGGSGFVAMLCRPRRPPGRRE